MVLERRARYRTFQTRPTPFESPFALRFTCSPPCAAPVLSPRRHFMTMHVPSHSAVFRAGIRNAADKILRATICRPVTPCR